MRELCNSLRGKTKEEVIQVLGQVQISPFQKNLLFIYVFPPIIQDRELLYTYPKIREAYLKGEISEPDLGQKELLLLMGAYRSEQYGKFIRHLLHSFIKNNGSSVYIDESLLDGYCAISGKHLFGFRLWSSICQPSDPSKNFLAYSSRNSELLMGRESLVRLQQLNQYLSVIEGPDYLVKWER